MKVPEKEAHKYGCLAIDPHTKEVLHYAEKPETFISDIINCGIYVFTPSMFYKTLDQSKQRNMFLCNHFSYLSKRFRTHTSGSKLSPIRTGYIFQNMWRETRLCL